MLIFRFSIDCLYCMFYFICFICWLSWMNLSTFHFEIVISVWVIKDENSKFSSQQSLVRLHGWICSLVWFGTILVTRLNNFSSNWITVKAVNLLNFIIYSVCQPTETELDHTAMTCRLAWFYWSQRQITFVCIRLRQTTNKLEQL